MTFFLVQLDENVIEEAKEYIVKQFSNAKFVTLDLLGSDSDLLKRLRKLSDDFEVTPTFEINESSIKQALHYIHNNYRKQITLTEIASHVHLNPVYFSQWFKHKTNYGFKEYVSQVRLQEARYWLMNSNETIAWIAEHVGYQDTAYISRLFRKKYGCSPGMYRKTHQKK